MWTQIARELPLDIRERFFWDDHPVYVPEVIRLLVRSALARFDTKTAEMFVRDYLAQQRVPMTRVSKFVPGTHFYVLNTKFDTLEEAKRHAVSQGYRVDPTVLETFVGREGS